MIKTLHKFDLNNKFDQMNTKSAIFIAIFALTLGLSGCASQKPNGKAANQAQLWSEAATQFKTCRKARWEQVVAYAPQWNQLVTGLQDPLYLEKMTSKAPLTKELKDSLIKYRPQQIACRKALFEALGDNNHEVKMMYQKNFYELDNGIVKIIDDKIKTMGEINQLYVAHNIEIAERRFRLMTLLENN